MQQTRADEVRKLIIALIFALLICSVCCILQHTCFVFLAFMQKLFAYYCAQANYFTLNLTLTLIALQIYSTQSTNLLHQ